MLKTARPRRVSAVCEPGSSALANGIKLLLFETAVAATRRIVEHTEHDESVPE